jgi:uncharacterized protein (DUF427 family)
MVVPPDPAASGSPPWLLADGRERVAAYPRPPALVPDGRLIRVEVFGRVLAETRRSLRVLETFHPPSFYLPPDAFDGSMLRPAAGRSFCEWKGVARYVDVVAPDGRVLERVAWHYPEPTAAFAPLAGWLALYAGPMEGCWVGGERVVPQQGSFYGGWITPELEGPFKGDPAHPELL